MMLNILTIKSGMYEQLCSINNEYIVINFIDLNTMKSQESKSSVSTLLELAVGAAIIITFALLTVVVIMLVTGSLHMINSNFLQLSFINIISTVAAVIIFFLSTSFLIKTFKSIRSSVIKALFHDRSEK